MPNPAKNRKPQMPFEGAGEKSKQMPRNSGFIWHEWSEITFQAFLEIWIGLNIGGNNIYLADSLCEVTFYRIRGGGGGVGAPRLGAAGPPPAPGSRLFMA